MDRALKVMKSLEKMGEKQFIPSIGPVKGQIIEKVIHEHKPERILEIGTLYGYSAILMARLLPEDGKVTTIEVDKKNAEIARTNIQDAGLADKIGVQVGDALHIIPKIDEKIDLLFIDAKKEKYLRYLKLAENKLKKGSVIVADNAGIFAEQMHDYLKYVRNSGIYKSNTIKTKLEFTDDTEDAIEVSVKNA